MTPPKARQAPSAPPAAIPDPLAEFRGDDDVTTTDDGPADGVTIRPMVDQDTQDEMVAEVVASWHLDPTSQGFLHRGGGCGCRYLAQHALRVAVPVMTEHDLDDVDQGLQDRT